MTNNHKWAIKLFLITIPLVSGLAYLINTHIMAEMNKSDIRRFKDNYVVQEKRDDRQDNDITKLQSAVERIDEKVDDIKMEQHQQRRESRENFKEIKELIIKGDKITH